MFMCVNLLRAASPFLTVLTTADVTGPDKTPGVPPWDISRVSSWRTRGGGGGVITAVGYT